MSDDDTARLRALATSANPGALIRGVTRGQVLRLLDALDAAERERDEARAMAAKWEDLQATTSRALTIATGESAGAHRDAGLLQAERDALAALLREAYRLLDTASDATQTFPMVSIGHWMDKANAALAAREG